VTACRVELQARDGANIASRPGLASGLFYFLKPYLCREKLLPKRLSTLYGRSLGAKLFPRPAQVREEHESVPFVNSFANFPSTHDAILSPLASTRKSKFSHYRPTPLLLGSRGFRLALIFFFLIF
jgi:hypothetical protein